MHLSSRRWCTILSVLLLSAAWAYYLVSSPSSSQDDFLNTLTEVKDLQSTTKELQNGLLIDDEILAKPGGSEIDSFRIGQDDLLISLQNENSLIHDNAREAIHEQLDREDHELDASALEKRWNTVYKDAVKDGKEFYQRLGKPDCVKVTAFHDYNQLGQWGWTSTESSDVERVIGSIQNVLGYKALHLSNFQDVRWTQSERTFHKDEKDHDVYYPPTGASFFNAYNPSGGAIIGYQNFNSEFKISHRIPPFTIAPSDKDERYADFPAGCFVSTRISLAKIEAVVRRCLLDVETPHYRWRNRKGLKWVIRLNVVNKATNDLIQLALKKNPAQYPYSVPWPGHTFSLPANPDIFHPTGPFYAMLSAPNCRGVAWLLAQHQGEEGFGRKTIKSITVWDSSDFQGPNVGFRTNIIMHVVVAQ